MTAIPVEDMGSAILLSIALMFVGSKAVANAPRQRQWGNRLATLAFVISALSHGLTAETADSSLLWIAAVVQGLVVGAVVLGVSWIAIPLVGFSFTLLIDRPLRMAAYVARRVGHKRREAWSERARTQQAWRERAGWERSAPERERARLQVEAGARIQAEAQRRREDARASALLSYSFYSAKLGDRFSREMFDQYVTTYMSDTHPPDVVERRGSELLAIFERHLADAQPPPRATTVDTLTSWYEQTKGQIAAMPIAAEVRDVRLAELERRFDELLSQHLEGMEP